MTTDSELRNVASEGTAGLSPAAAESQAKPEEPMGAVASAGPQNVAPSPALPAGMQKAASPREDAIAEAGTASRLFPSALAGRSFGRADTPALLARLPAGLRVLHGRIEQEFPGRDLSEIQVLAQTLLDKRSQFPDTLGDAEREALHVWTLETEAVSDALVEQRALELGLARGGIENDRGFWLAGFQDGRPAYTWTMNAAAAESTGVNLVRLVPSYDTQLATPADGTGLYVNVNDHGTIYDENPEFQLPSAGGTRIVFKEINDSGSRDHMTHCAGTVGAWGYTANLMGMAPRVWIRSHIQQYTGDITLHGMAWPGQMHSSTNPRTGETEMKSVMGTTSLGWDYTGPYESTASSFDSTLRDYPYYTHFYAAANNGSAYNTLSAGNTMAKNVVTIGSVTDTVRDDAGNYTSGGNVDGFSSRGPTFDGRIKPELTANGNGLTSPTSATGSGSKSGTSMATPNASGSATLLIDYIRKKLPGHYVRSSTIKALLVNTATDRGTAGPDYFYGYGIINVKAAADIVKRYAENPSTRVVLEDRLSSSQTWTQTYTYDGTGPIRVTLAWIDPAGASQPTDTTDRSPRLVNNLNLRLIGPGGVTYLPYVMPFTTGNGTLPAYDPGLYAAVAVTGDNFTDNVEQVLIAAPPAGTYTLQVTHAGSLQGGNPQPFSLAASGLAANAPTHSIASVSPNTGNATDNFILGVNGTNFGLGYDVILRRAGSADQPAYGIIPLSGQITCRVDTAALAKGYWDVVVRAPGGVEAVLPNAFLLPQVQGGTVTLYSNNFDGGAGGLILDAGWEVGVPNQGPSGPTTASSTPNVLGTYLNGSYANDLLIRATLPSVSTVGMDSATLAFQRWLGVNVKNTGNPKNYDYARIHYSINAGQSWVQLFATSNNTSTTDSRWTAVSYSLPLNQPDVRVRFELQTDGAGVSFGWNIDDLVISGNSQSLVLNPPIFTSTPAGDPVKVGASYTYSVTTSDADTPGASLTLTANGLPAGLSFTPNGSGGGTISGNPSVSGTAEITLAVSDGSYTTYQIYDLLILPEGGNTAPQFLTTSLPDAHVGAPYSATVTASDADGHSLSFTLSGNPSWMVFSDNGNGTASLSGTPPTGSNGTLSLSFSVSDGFESDGATLPLTIRPRATVGFTSATASVGEGGGSITLSVSRSGNNAGPVTVNYATANGTATAGSDYSARSGTLAWADGETGNKTFSVTILDDQFTEGSETFNVNLSALSGIASLGTSTVTVTITDNDSNLAPTVVITSPATSVALPDRSNALHLSAGITDDGKPSWGSLGSTWSQVSGPAGQNAVFENANAANTRVTFPADGAYILRISVSDGEFSVTRNLSVTVGGAAAFGASGLAGTYFSNNSLSAPATLERVDSTVDFTWSGSPDASLPADNFSVRWTGVIVPAHSETYTFFTRTDDGVRLYLNGVLVINQWKNQSATEYSTTLACSAGSPVSVVMEYYEAAGGAVAQLSWSSPSVPKAIIPVSALFTELIPNAAPAVNPGPAPAPAPMAGAAAPLTGSASDDGFPSGSSVSVLWTQVSGPGAVIFDDPAVASTSATFSAAGDYVLRLQASDSSATVSATLAVTVSASVSNTAPTISGIAPQNIPAYGGSGALAFTVGDAETQADSLEVSVLSDNPALFPEGSLVLGGSAANRTLTATPASPLFGSALVTLTVSDGLLTASTSFTISVAAPLASILVLSPESALVGKGGAFDFSAVVLDSHDNPLSPQPVITWSVSGGGTMDAQGRFTAGDSAGGPHTVTASSGALSDTAQVSVTAPVATTLVISPDTATVPVYGTRAFSATVYDQAANLMNPQPVVSWSVSGGGSIDAGGLFTAGSSPGGPFIVTAISDGATNTASVTVSNSAPAVSILSPSSANLALPEITNHLRLSALASDAESSPSVVWSQVNGPGTATFADPAASETSVTFDLVGDYVLRVTASDGLLSSSAELTVRAGHSGAGVADIAPRVVTGTAPAFVAGTPVPLAGLVEDDGAPAALSSTWSRVSGLGAVTFQDPASPTTAVTFSSAGSFVLRLTATDGQATVFQDLSVSVAAAAPAVTAWPTASDIDYGQTLADSMLSGGEASVAGSFAFAAPATLPAPGTANHDVVFTPADSVNYNTVTGSVSVSVSNLESGSLLMAGGSTPGMSIPSSTALRYRLQYKNNLLDPAWLDFNPLLWTDGTGAVLELTDPSSGAPLRFYILVAEPKP